MELGEIKYTKGTFWNFENWAVCCENKTNPKKYIEFNNWEAAIMFSEIMKLKEEVRNLKDSSPGDEE